MHIFVEINPGKFVFPFRMIDAWEQYSPDTWSQLGTQLFPIETSYGFHHSKWKDLEKNKVILTRTKIRFDFVLQVGDFKNSCKYRWLSQSVGFGLW